MTRRPDYFLLCALFGLVGEGFFSACLSAEPYYWEKAIPDGRLLATRVELTGKAYDDKLEQLTNSGRKFVRPDRYYTYELSLVSTGRTGAKRLWQGDFAELDENPVRYRNPRDLQFLDVCVDTSTGTSCLLLKQRNVTKVEIARATPQGIMIVSGCATNILELDAPGVWITESGEVTCMKSNLFKVALKTAGGRVVAFAWQNGKWVRQKPNSP